MRFTPEMIAAFCRATGDTNPIHDSRATPDPVVPGFLMESYIRQSIAGPVSSLNTKFRGVMRSQDDAVLKTEYDAEYHPNISFSGVSELYLSSKVVLNMSLIEPSDDEGIRYVLASGRIDDFVTGIGGTLRSLDMLAVSLSSEALIRLIENERLAIPDNFGYVSHKIQVSSAANNLKKDDIIEITPKTVIVPKSASKPYKFSTYGSSDGTPLFRCEFLLMSISSS